MTQTIEIPEKFRNPEWKSHDFTVELIPSGVGKQIRKNGVRKIVDRNGARIETDDEKIAYDTMRAGISKAPWDVSNQEEWDKIPIGLERLVMKAVAEYNGVDEEKKKPSNEPSTN